MDFKDLSPELREKAKACKTPEEMLELAKEEGYELSDEELEEIAAAGSWTDSKCPACGSENLHRWPWSDKSTCRDCGANW